MGFLDKLSKSKGGYIFLSHSHDDIKKVREIRNNLETEGFEPLCFYLKCLTDDSEIEDLIKREIDAREWFVFVNSENSRKSRWVTLEREYITRTNSKKIITVDLNDGHAVAHFLHKITHNLRVFLFATAYDAPLAQRIQAQLEEKDYLVFYQPEGVTTAEGPDCLTTALSALQEAAQEGAVLFLLTPSIVQSYYFFREIAQILQTGNIFPVVVGDVTVPDYYNYLFETKQKFYLPAEPTDEMIAQMVDQIGKAIIKDW